MKYFISLKKYVENFYPVLKVLKSFEFFCLSKPPIPLDIDAKLLTRWIEKGLNQLEIFHVTGFN